MAIHTIHLDDVPPQPWRNGGGRTRELLCWPTADDWAARISVADIDGDGPFSAWPGVERWFAVVDGAGVVLALPGGDRRSTPGSAPLRFDGDDAPTCRLIDGPTRDLNLMLRGATGTMGRPAAGTLRAVFAIDKGTFDDGRNRVALTAGTLLWSDDAGDAAWRFDGPHAHWLSATRTDA